MSPKAFMRVPRCLHYLVEAGPLRVLAPVPMPIPIRRAGCPCGHALVCVSVPKDVPVPVGPRRVCIESAAPVSNCSCHFSFVDGETCFHVWK